MIDRFWNLLGGKLVIFFGRESASAATLMFTFLLLRALVSLLRIQWLVPNGYIFACPYIVQVVMTYFPFLADNYPIITVRLTETVLGRLSPKNFYLMIPSHFLGSIFGAVMFTTLFPGSEVLHGPLDPIIYSTKSSQFDALNGLLIEAFLSCLYCTTIIAIPEILAVNKLSDRMLVLPILPLMFICVPNITSSFNPSAVAALWYLNSSSWRDLQIEHIIGPMFGAYIAGCICLRLFPDDPTSWKKK